jgi:hypothetical protein
VVETAAISPFDGGQLLQLGTGWLLVAPLAQPCRKLQIHSVLDISISIGIGIRVGFRVVTFTFTHAGTAHTVTHPVTHTIDLGRYGKCSHLHGGALFVHIVPSVRVLLRLPRGCGLRSLSTGFLAQASLLLL